MELSFVSEMMRLRESCVISFRGDPRGARHILLLRRGAERRLFEVFARCIDRKYLDKKKGHNVYRTKPASRQMFEADISLALSIRRSTVSILIDRYCS
jgi:hypothetical protein